MRHLGLILFLAGLHLSRAVCASAGEAPGTQTEWERTRRAAEQEGQVAVYIAGYDALIDSSAFQKAYPKIRVVSAAGSGTQLAERIAAERRAGKYLADVYNGGGNSLFQVLYQGTMLDPIKPVLMLPEILDQSKWWEGKHMYVDREGQYIFVYEGNVSGGVNPGYNINFIKPADFKSYCDFLDPKLKGKIVSIDIRKVRGAGRGGRYHRGG